VTDVFEHDHMDAALALLRADSGLTVYPDAQGFVPAAFADHYVRVYCEIDRPIDGPANKIDGLSASWVVRWYCHCVGPNEYSAVAVAGRVRALLLDVTPSITGRVCWPIRQDASQPTIRDESTGTTAYDRVLVFAMTTGPAVAYTPTG
jgi:hypothetical protein